MRRRRDEPGARPGAAALIAGGLRRRRDARRALVRLYDAQGSARTLDPVEPAAQRALAAAEALAEAAGSTL